jgi:hypothetical protein
MNYELDAFIQRKNHSISNIQPFNHNYLECHDKYNSSTVLYFKVSTQF